MMYKNYQNLLAGGLVALLMGGCDFQADPGVLCARESREIMCISSGSVL